MLPPKAFARQAPRRAPEAGRSGGRKEAKVASLRVASSIVAPVKLAPLRSAPMKCAPLALASVRLWWAGRRRSLSRCPPCNCCPWGARTGSQA
eukprot:scaffold21917_cov53-Phaeocystis_antarctica.AAC.3